MLLSCRHSEDSQKLSAIAAMVLVKRTVLLGWRSPAAWRNSCERGELVHVRDVDAWASCWIPQNSVPLISRTAPAFAAASCCGFFLWSSCNLIHRFRMCGCFPACALGNRRLKLIFLHNLSPRRASHTMMKIKGDRDGPKTTFRWLGQKEEKVFCCLSSS